MAQFVNMFQVNLKNSSSQIANINTVYQGNANANRVGAVVLDGNEPYPLTGTCAGAVSRDDGTFVPLVGVVSGNEAYVVLDSNCYEVLGPLRITITVTNGNEETTLIAIYGNVEATGSGNIIQPAERLPDYVQLLGEIQAMRTATAAANAAASKSVRYDTAQSLTDAEKAVARKNIDAVKIEVQETGLLIIFNSN